MIHAVRDSIWGHEFSVSREVECDGVEWGWEQVKLVWSIGSQPHPRGWESRGYAELLEKQSFRCQFFFMIYHLHAPLAGQKWTVHSLRWSVQIRGPVQHFPGASEWYQINQVQFNHIHSHQRRVSDWINWFSTYGWSFLDQMKITTGPGHIIHLLEECGSCKYPFPIQQTPLTRSIYAQLDRDGGCVYTLS